VRASEYGTSFYLLVLTARGEKSDIVAALDSGADDYIIKPYHSGELRARVRVGERILSLQASLNDRVSELEEALGQVRALEGILPICCYCKRIRDDQNYWQQVESYISQHSQAQFSHGICPGCWEAVIKPELEGELRSRQEASPACEHG
jgi:response regulator RpfG family c-di-GMP phosphodiesterase